jgi:hypothetical protein
MPDERITVAACDEDPCGLVVSSEAVEEAYVRTMSFSAEFRCGGRTRGRAQRGRDGYDGEEGQQRAAHGLIVADAGDKARQLNGWVTSPPIRRPRPASLRSVTELPAVAR